MVSLRSLYTSRHHFYKLLKHQYPSHFVRNPLLGNSSSYLSTFWSSQERGPSVKAPIPISTFQRHFSDGCAELVSEDVTEKQMEVEMADCNEGPEKLEEKIKTDKKGKNISTVAGNGVIGETETLEENKLSAELKQEGNGVVEISKKLEKKGSAKVQKKKGRVFVDPRSREIEKLKKTLEELEKEVSRSNVNIENSEKNEMKSEEQLKVQSRPTSLHAAFTASRAKGGSKKVEVKMKGRKKGESNVVGGNVSVDSMLKEIEKLKKRSEKLEMKLKNSERRVHNCEKNEEQPNNQFKNTSLHAAFTGKPKDSSENTAKPKDLSDKENRGDVSQRKQLSGIVKSKPLKKTLSPEMLALVGRWQEEGYLKKPLALSEEEFSLSSYAKQYDPDFLRFTAEKFANDHQEIAKSLSGSDLKKVALFGCPSVQKQSVFAAKRLRFFFKIQEDIVCRGCKLKSSCQFADQIVWGAKNKFNFVDAMRVLTSYSVYSFPELEISQEVKASIDNLLKEVANLSK